MRTSCSLLCLLNTPRGLGSSTRLLFRTATLINIDNATGRHYGAARWLQGLSHSVIDEELDWMVLDAMTAKDAEALCALPVDRLIRGTSEIRNWIVVAGAVEPTDMTIVDYVPYYRSPAGTGCAGGFTYWI